jgi:hypothetical protein
MLASCLDFVSKSIELKAKGEEMEVRVNPVTKLYPEMAREGIGYLCWGVRKGWYHSNLLELKIKPPFSNLDPESVMTRKRVRNFSKKARTYI